MSDSFTTYDAAYVLGALSPQERHEFEEHLRTCAECRAAVANLAGVPGLLARVSPEDAEQLRDQGEIPVVPLPDTVLPRLQSAVRGRRRRRTVWQVAAATVAAAACLVLGLWIGTPAPTAPSPAASVVLPMHSVAAVPVDATVSLRYVTWGTKVQIKCNYHGDEDYPSSYRMLVVDRAGQREQVASWSSVPGASMTVDGSTKLKNGQIALIEVLGDAGKVLLTATPS